MMVSTSTRIVNYHVRDDRVVDGRVLKAPAFKQNDCCTVRHNDIQKKYKLSQKFFIYPSTSYYIKNVLQFLGIHNSSEW